MSSLRAYPATQTPLQCTVHDLRTRGVQTAPSAGEARMSCSGALVDNRRLRRSRAGVGSRPRRQISPRSGTSKLRRRDSRRSRWCVASARPLPVIHAAFEFAARHPEVLHSFRASAAASATVTATMKTVSSRRDANYGREWNPHGSGAALRRRGADGPADARLTARRRRNPRPSRQKDPPEDPPATSDASPADGAHETGGGQPLPGCLTPFTRASTSG